MKFRKSLVFIAGVLFILISCTTNPDAYAPIDAGVQEGSYEAALVSINDERGNARRNIYTSKNEILLHLDRGMIHHYAGQYAESSEDFEIAGQLIEDAFTKSLSQEVGSFLMNDNVKDYSGEDYEDLYINVFSALNYYHNGKMEGALVEIRRVNEKLVYLADKYEQAKEKVIKSNEQMDASELQIEASSFSNSALARYLGMLFFRGTGKNDDARIDYEELKRAYELAPMIYTNQIPSSVGEELSVPRETGRLNIIAFTGLSPVKMAEDIRIPIPLPFPYNTARLSLPVMVDRPSIVNRVEVVLDNGQRFNLELIEDIGAVAKETFKSRRGLIILKSTARSIAKNVVSAGVAGAGVRSSNNQSSGLLVAGLIGKIAADVSEQADIRLSRYFPSSALVGGINLPPGHYTVTVNYYGYGGQVHSEQKEIEVRSNTLNLGEFFFLK